MTAQTGPGQFNAPTVTAPAYDGFDITTSDTINEDTPFRALYVGVGGDVVLITMAGTQLTFKNVPDGQILPWQGVRVNTTNTTATNMIGAL